VDDSKDQSIGSDVAGESDAASPGSGRAKLRLSRGFPLVTPDSVLPHEFLFGLLHAACQRRLT
jgi:hypothetical protein